MSQMQKINIQPHLIVPVLWISARRGFRGAVERVPAAEIKRPHLSSENVQLRRTGVDARGVWLAAGGDWKLTAPVGHRAFHIVCRWMPGLLGRTILSLQGHVCFEETGDLSSGI